MANLGLSFSDCYTKVSEYLGLTSYSTAPTGTDLTRCKDIVYRAYRRFCFPIDAQTKKPYFWSFLQKDGSLVTVADTWKYALPSDFVCLAAGLKFNNAENYPPLVVKDEAFISELRSLSTASAIPRFCAICNGMFDAEVGQTRYLKVFPAPNAALTYFYTYIFSPPKPEDSTDLIIGGVVAAETFLQCCLAAAELQEKAEQLQQGQAGFQEIRAKEMLDILIQSDKKLLRNLEDEPKMDVLPVMPTGAT